MDFIVIWVIAVLSITFIGIICGFVEWSRNNSQPQIAIETRVVKIRDRDWFVSRGTSYYFNFSGNCSITFELLSGDKKMNIRVPLYELEKINEGDTGVLTLQGTQYISFIHKH